MTSEDELRVRLRSEAAGHQPDETAVWRRVERGRLRDGAGRTGSYSRRPRLRLVPVLAGAAGVLGVSVAGWALAGHFGAPGPSASAPRATASHASAGPATGGAATASPAPTGRTTVRPAPTGGATASPAPAAVPSSTGPATPEQGFLWSDGSIDPNSNDSWAQSNVTLKNRQPVTALDVRLRVAVTAGVADTGSWSTVPAGDLVSTVTRQDGFLVYEFVLKRGVTLAPGSYLFAGQYNHAHGGRDAGRDGYGAVAAGPSGQVAVSGDFYPTH